MKSFTIPVPLSELQEALSSIQNSVNDTFKLNGRHFRKTAEVRVRVKNQNQFRIVFVNPFAELNFRRDYQLFEMTCECSARDNHTTLISYTLQLKTLTWLSLAFSLIALTLIGLSEWYTDHLDGFYWFFVAMFVPMFAFIYFKGKRDTVRNARQFLTMFPTIVHKAHYPDPFAM